MMTRLVSSLLQLQHSKKGVVLLLLVVVMRIIGWCTHHGYIHPDEFFQSGQELWYGIRVPSWEFQSSHCLRSIVPPTIMTFLPLFLWNQLIAVVPSTTVVVYVIPRIFMGVVSFVVLDLPLWFFHTNNNNNNNTMLIWSSMWTTWTFFHRPFTNVMESWYVAITLHLLLLLRRSSSNNHHHPVQIVVSYIGLGIVTSLGMNCRFTFVLFVGPAILYHFYTTFHSSSSFMRNRGMMASMMVGFLGTSLLWITMDTNYYNQQKIQITPWNAFQYNRQVSNLQHHGIHPQYLHLLVNMPLLYGPLALHFYYTELIIPFVVVPQTTTTRKPLDNYSISMKLYCRIIIWSGLLGLSIAPHQEPRFLLPLAYPLVQLYSTTTNNILFQNKLFQSIWWIWTISVGCWFSCIHQSAVIPSLHYLSQQQQQQSQSSKAIIYYHTYMPPTFMLSSSNIKLVMGDIPLSSAVCPSLQLSQEEVVTKFYDLTSNDATLDTLDHILHRHLNTTNDSSSFVYVVAPQASIIPTINNKTTYEWTPLWSQFQISVEEVPSTPFIHTLLTNPSSFHLVIWKVQTIFN